MARSVSLETDVAVGYGPPAAMGAAVWDQTR